MKILIIEDEEGIAAFLARGLRGRSHLADLASDGEKGSFMARSSHYDLIVLDLNLPKLSGLEVLKEIRKAGVQTPVIAISVEGDPLKKGELFAQGADDYLSKPFLLDEFIWRAEALMRRPPAIAPKIWRLGELQLDAKSQIARRNGRRIYLTNKEYSLLELFFRRRDEVLSRSQILENAWDSNADIFSNTIEAHIMSLRKKINQKGERDYIHTFPAFL